MEAIAGLQIIDLAGSQSRAPAGFSRLQFTDQIQRALETVRQALWLATSTDAVIALLRALPFQARRADLRVLVLADVAPAVVNALHAHFRFVVPARDRALALLPDDDLIHALEDDERRDELFIGGQVNPASVLLYRGNLAPLTVPREWFVERPASPQPDFGRLGFADGGQTVCLGDYEVASGALLYEFDESYRVRAKQRSRDSDRSLGGSIRRLRLQKGLTQSDFPGVSAKEISRIEKGEVSTPHAATLTAIAARAGVAVEQLSSF